MTISPLIILYNLHLIMNTAAFRTSSRLTDVTLLMTSPLRSHELICQPSSTYAFLTTRAICLQWLASAWFVKIRIWEINIPLTSSAERTVFIVLCDTHNYYCCFVYVFRHLLQWFASRRFHFHWCLVFSGIQVGTDVFHQGMIVTMITDSYRSSRRFLFNMFLFFVEKIFT